MITPQKNSAIWDAISAQLSRTSQRNHSFRYLDERQTPGLVFVKKFKALLKRAEHFVARPLEEENHDERKLCRRLAS
jgi:hypothetical protein